MLKNDTLTKVLKQEINNLIKINEDIEYVVIATYDGLPIVSNVTNSPEEHILASIAAIVKVLGDKVNQTISSGELKYILFNYSKRKILVISFKEIGVLIIAKEKARTGILMRDTMSFIDKIRNYL